MSATPPSTSNEPTPPGGTERSGTNGAPERAGALSARSLLMLAAIVAIVGGVAALTISSGSSRPSAGNIHGVASSRYRGSVATPPETEPPLALRSYTGQRVNIDQYRGKAVLVTFLYTKCPDVCPIIASNLGVSLNLLGAAKASHVQLLAVSVDPRGDTPKAVRAFLARRKLIGRMQYLIGNAHELARVWKAWNVGSEQDSQDPGLVNHSGLVYGVSGSGKLTTLYAANFQPSEIVHDAPLLASS
jgi:protein SCO1